MAIGLSKLIGIDLPINFSSPYKSTSIIEFWRRWHMTLSRFLRDYLYFPLGGNRRGRIRQGANLMVTMLIGGLWHGANWTFVAWGGLHGMYLLINRGWRFMRPPSTHPTPLGNFLAGVVTFLAVVVGWVLFRAADFGAAIDILRGMAGMNGAAMAAVQHAELQALLLLAALLVWTMPNTQQIAGKLEGLSGGSDSALTYRAAPALAGVLLALALLQMEKVSEFLYFQF
jgi:D-alanyl-lipoteichoic acid acyltransferase DltB (MBOAT superfamily)